LIILNACIDPECRNFRRYHCFPALNNQTQSIK
jgi:hypothetical protein